MRNTGRVQKQKLAASLTIIKKYKVTPRTMTI